MSGALAATFATVGGAGGGGGGGGGGGAIVNPTGLDGNTYYDQGVAGADPTSSVTVTFYPNGTWSVEGWNYGQLDNGNWFNPLQAGIGASYWVKFTLTSTTGSSTGTSWTTTTGWQALTSNRTFYVICTAPTIKFRQASYKIEIASSSGGTPVVSTSNTTLISQLS